MQLISGIRDWKCVFMQMMVTLSTCCDVACLICSATQHNRLFGQPPVPRTAVAFSEQPTFGGKQYTFHQMYEFCISQGSAVTLFQVWWASSQSRLQIVLFWDNINNKKYMWIILLKWLFGFPEVKWLQLTDEAGKAMTCWCKIFLGFHVPTRNSAGDEIANVNFCAVRSGSYQIWWNNAK